MMIIQYYYVMIWIYIQKLIKNIHLLNILYIINIRVHKFVYKIVFMEKYLQLRPLWQS